ncbi:Putative protein without homology [Lacticaseibacillus rhamnosus GG]|nr:Putative protein without homology [Lacticaseibacillus rhamnosus GG]
MPITRSPAQGSACKGLERNGQARAIVFEATYTSIPKRAGSRLTKKHHQHLAVFLYLGLRILMIVIGRVTARCCVVWLFHTVRRIVIMRILVCLISIRLTLRLSMCFFVCLLFFILVFQGCFGLLKSCGLFAWKFVLIAFWHLAVIEQAENFFFIQGFVLKQGFGN